MDGGADRGAGRRLTTGQVPKRWLCSSFSDHLLIPGSYTDEDDS